MAKNIAYWQGSYGMRSMPATKKPTLQFSWDAADFVRWRKGGPLMFEVDTPGTANAADYTAWRARFGNTSGSGAAFEITAVPEATTFVSMTLGLLELSPIRRKRPSATNRDLFC